MCLMAFSVCVVCSCTKNESETSSDEQQGTTNPYVDLGLSSGTKWKNANEVKAADAENAFFTYDEAVARFGDKLPSREQCLELVTECDWIRTESGYKVTGSNGNFIVLPAAGVSDGDGNATGVGAVGYYWSYTPYSSEEAWGLLFGPGGTEVYNLYRSSGYSVRLVQD